MKQTWLYEGWRDGESVVGTARELAEVTGVALDTLKLLSRSGKRGRLGWSFRRISSVLKYTAYSATKTAEGTAREVAEVMGISEWSVRVAAHDGKPVGQRSTGHGIIVNYTEADMSRAFIPNYYRAGRGSETYYGNADEIGRLVGLEAASVAKAANRITNVTLSGWTISRVTWAHHPPEYKPKRQNYMAVRDGDDPIMGDAEEIGELIGCASTSVARAERGSGTVRGWTIRKATDEEVKEFERQWA